MLSISLVAPVATRNSGVGQMINMNFNNLVVQYFKNLL